jgi:hypothetical protein
MILTGAARLVSWIQPIPAASTARLKWGGALEIAEVDFKAIRGVPLQSFCLLPAYLYMRRFVHPVQICTVPQLLKI